MKKYVLSLFAVILLTVSPSVFPHAQNMMDDNGYESFTREDTGTDDVFMMDGEGGYEMPCEKWGYGKGTKGWGHMGMYMMGNVTGWGVGFMFLHALVWFLFLGLSAYVFRIGWNMAKRSDNRKKK